MGCVSLPAPDARRSYSAAAVGLLVDEASDETADLTRSRDSGG